MAFGIRVINDHGSVLIDDQAPVFGVTAEGAAFVKRRAPLPSLIAFPALCPSP